MNTTRVEVKRETCEVWPRLGYAPTKVYTEWRRENGTVVMRGFYFDETPPKNIQ